MTFHSLPGRSLIRRIADYATPATGGHFPYLCLLITANLVVYRDYWLLNVIFNGADFFTQQVPLVNFQVDCMKEFSWPLWNPYMNFGYPWVENYVNSSLLIPRSVIAFFSGYSFEIAQLEILGWIILGGIGIYLCVIEFGLSRGSALVSGICFMFSGQLISLPHGFHHVYNASGFPFLLLGYHRSLRLNAQVSFMSVFFLSMTVFGGATAPTVLGIYFFAGYVLIDAFLRKKLLWGAKFLLLVLVLTALVTSPKLLPLYKSMLNSPRLRSPVYSDPRFGLVSTYNFLTYFLPVKYYFSLYIGELGLLSLLYAAFRRKVRVDASLFMFLLSAWFLLYDRSGGPSVLRSLAHMILPFTDLIRLEFMYWYFPSIFAILWLSRSVDFLLRDGDRKATAFAAAAFALVLSALFFLEYSVSLYYRAYLFHLVLALLVVLAAASLRNTRAQVAAVCLLLTVEFATVFDRVSIDLPPQRADNFVLMPVADQNYIDQSFRNDELVKDRWTVTMSPDYERPSISDSRQWPYLMPIPPGNPPNFAETMNTKRFAGWWYNNQERADFVQLKESPYFLSLENQPLFSLLDSSTGTPVNAVSLDYLSCSEFSFKVRAPGTSVLVLRQMHDARWRVLVDQKEEPLIRAEGFFMGAELAPGEHTVDFVFRDSLFLSGLALSSLTVLGMLALWIAERRKRKGAGQRAA